MRQLRAVLDAVLRHVTVPEDAYVELLNVHYFSDTKDGLKGEAILAEIPPQAICNHEIAARSKFLVLGLGKGWAARFSRRVADAIVSRGGTISIIAPDGHQANAPALRVRRMRWGSEQGFPALPSSVFANPIGASKAWKEAYVEQVAAEIVASLNE